MFAIYFFNLILCFYPGDTFYRRNDDTGSYHFNAPKSRYLSGRSDHYDENNYYKNHALHSYESNLKNHRNYFLNHRNIDRKAHDEYSSEYDSSESHDSDMRDRAQTNREIHMLDHDMNHVARPSLGNENVSFTHLSNEANLENYKNQLENSKVFKFKANFDFVANFNLLSTTKFYHPQLYLSETTDEKNFKKVEGSNEYGNYSAKYALLKNRTYVVEIGTDKEVFTGPFKDISSGGFIAVFSSNVRAIPDLMESETIKIEATGYSGNVIYKNKESLNLYKSSGLPVNFGRLNYEITPFYDQSNNSISLYYIDGSNEQRGRKNRSSTVEIKGVEEIRNCETPNCRPYFGTEHKDAEFNFFVESRVINELTNVLNK